MSTFSKQFIHSVKSLGIVTFIALISVCPQALLAATTTCTRLIPLAAGEAWRDPGRGLGADVCFDLEIEAPGIVVIDLISTTEPRAHLIFDGPGRLQQTPTSLVAVSPSSMLRVRVAGEDPYLPLPPFRLETRFAVATVKSETDGETELDPDPFAGSSTKSETDGETELDPDPFAGSSTKSETDGETELDPDPLVAHDVSLLPAPLRAKMGEICRQESDDHGDSFLCATALSKDGAIGEIASAWGDDVDVFRFRVKELTPVGIDIRTDSELVVELYDRHGLPIDVSVTEDGALRWARILVPGTYFARVRSLHGTSSNYSIFASP